MLAKIEYNQERLEAKMNSHHEKQIATMKDAQEMIEAMMEACIEKEGVRDMEANPEEIVRVGAP
jgi:hypothetical protein